MRSWRPLRHISSSCAARNGVRRGISSRACSAGPRGWRDSFRHFHTFARVAVDRVFLLSPAGSRIPMRVTGREKMEAALRAGGCILLSAHFGSFEAARQAGP